MVGYQFLRVSRVFFLVAAFLVTLVLLIAGVVILVAGGDADTPRIMGLGVILNAVVVFFILFSFAATIRLLLDIAKKLGLPGGEESP